jgi:hypothetical protein
VILRPYSANYCAKEDSRLLLILELVKNGRCSIKEKKFV